MRRIVASFTLVVLASALLVASAAGSATAHDEQTCAKARPHDPGTTAATFDHDGVERTYNLSVPEGYDGKTQAPVILSFHGLGESKDAHDGQTRLPVEGTVRGYVVVTPQALPVELPLNDDGSGVTIPFWNVTPVTEGGVYEQPGGLDAEDDVAFVGELVKSLAKELCLDTKHVFVTGMSNGAGMAIQLACLFPNRYAAAAPVAGGNMTTECPAKRPIPVLSVHGDADALAVYEGGTVAGFELGNPSVEERMAELAKLDGCTRTPKVDDVSPDVTKRTWTGCTKGNDVVLFTIHGGPHVWPGAAAPVDATTEILEFFDAHGGDAAG